MDFQSATCEENTGSCKGEERKSRLAGTETEQTLHKKQAGFCMGKRPAKMSGGLGKSLPQRELKSSVY